MSGHNHGGKKHLLGMVGIGAVVLVVLLVAGRSLGEALPLAAALACPLMMIGMMFVMMRSSNGNRDDDATGVQTGQVASREPGTAQDADATPAPANRP